MRYRSMFEALGTCTNSVALVEAHIVVKRTVEGRESLRLCSECALQEGMVTVHASTLSAVLTWRERGRQILWSMAHGQLA